MQALAEQRGQLVDMLSALDKLSDVSVRTLNASQKNMVEDMRLLEPILSELAESGDALPNSLELLLTYPFPDSVLDAIKGDYLNVFATATYTSLPASCSGIGCAWPQLPDETTLPAFDPFAGTSGGGNGLRVPDSKTSKPDQASGGNQSPSTSAKPSPSVGPKSGAASPTPSLLPPTDSALPGLPEPSVQVPTESASPSATAGTSPSSSPED